MILAAWALLQGPRRSNSRQACPLRLHSIFYSSCMKPLTHSPALLVFVALAINALAEAPIALHWHQLADPFAQQFEDPYLDLTKPQFESLMVLARTRLALAEDLPPAERASLSARAEEVNAELEAQGLRPGWILDQREVVAARRERAAVATNPELEGSRVELTGYMLAGTDAPSGERVVYLLPDRGVCMHLPAPRPNQLLKLDIDVLPSPLGPCIAATVRGRLTARQEESEVPVLDDEVSLWSSWALDVEVSSTSGPLPKDLDNE